MALKAEHFQDSFRHRKCLKFRARKKTTISILDEKTSKQHSSWSTRVGVAYFGHLREDHVISPTHDVCLITIA